MYTTLHVHSVHYMYTYYMYTTLHVQNITLPVLPPSSSPCTCLPWSVSTYRSGSLPPQDAGCNTFRSVG